ncbi:MAG: ABC transporter permease, partial [Alphaproteobacteria bacterium]|nr:ABC transporter permease [Alphaproteobacteria bacterium]
MTGVAWRLARRELRGGLRGFGIFLGCLALGVAAIAAAGSLGAALDRALDDDARALLGGDLSIRLSQRPLTPAQDAVLREAGAVSRVVELRAMAFADQRRALVELKAVDSAYPLYGRLRLDPPDATLERRDGEWGAAADANLLTRLGLSVGDVVRVGDARFRLRATVTREPDRVAGVLALGPRLMIDSGALPETGLLMPGSLASYLYRVATPDHAALRADLKARFPDAGWQVRDSGEAAPGVRRFLDNVASFLSLVGLTALLVGGIGVAGAVRAFVEGRKPTIAMLKAVGATG